MKTYENETKNVILEQKNVKFGVKNNIKKHTKIKEIAIMAQNDINKAYLDKLEQIKNDIKIAVFSKKWSEVAKLEAEKARLESAINNIKKDK
jgi:hypothetical protein